jgi:hypothetical protein
LTLILSISEILGQTLRNINIFCAPESIQGGEKWLNTLKSKLLQSDLIIVLWTKNSMESCGQFLEVGAGWILDKEFLVVNYNIKSCDLPFVLRDIQKISWEKFPTEFQAIISKMKSNYNDIQSR